MKKDKGAVEYSVSLLLIFVSVLLILYGIRMRAAKVEKSYVEDALVSSNLAAAVIDTDIYGATEEIIISDTMDAYERFKQSLKTNLQLNEAYEPLNTYLMENPVKILAFHIYNYFMEEDQIVCVSFDEYGNKSVKTFSASGVKTPDGKEIETTTIYSKIEFDVKGFLDQRFRMTLENSVDVVKN